jgi:hypothetical protein
LETIGDAFPDPESADLGEVINWVNERL